MKADKKAVLISLALHGSLLGAFLGGSAFIHPTPQEPPVVNLPLIHLTQVPSILTDEAIFNPGGAPEIGEPAPEPPVAQPAPPAPAPEPAKVEQPKKQETKPVKEPVKEVKKTETKKPAETKKPVEKKPTTPKTVDLSKLVVKPDKAKAEREARERAEAEAAEAAAAKAAAEYASKMNAALSGAIATAKGSSSGAVTSLGSSSASGTSVKGAAPGNGDGTGIGPSVANYNQYVISLYNRSWNCPTDLTDAGATTTVEVKINKDGSIRSSRITKRSGNKSLDDSVQRTLDIVAASGVPPLPKGASEPRTLTINFNLKNKF
ncbi:MAG: cell envelope integrity protein TolA [Verrucomicrobia bacterium]|nr:cell envelope integrity protein TolA [Verrucomicrobiota bacterium]